MGLFGLFKRHDPPIENAVDGTEVSGKLTQLLWHAVQTDPDLVANPDAGVVLNGGGQLRIARDGHEALRGHDVSQVLFRQDRAAHDEWIDDLRCYETETFRQNATEDFAKRLAGLLAVSAGRTGVKPLMTAVLALPDGVAVACNEL